MCWQKCLLNTVGLLFLSSFAQFSDSCPDRCSCSNFHVHCYGKALTKIPEDFPPDAVFIDLQTNAIKSIGHQFHNLTLVEEIVLRFNLISDISESAFSNMPNLKRVNLCSNRLTMLNKNVFQNVPKMSILDLTDNQLTTVDDSFNNLSSLTKLVLTRNSIRELTENGLQALTNLVYLLAEENQISHVSPTAFLSLNQLSYMAISKNPLNNVDNIFSENHRLSYLNLQHCNLTSIPRGLPWAIRYLQLNNNNIRNISKDAFKQTRFLGIIILDDNQITQIQPGAFMPIAYLQQLWLNGNQLTSFPAPIPASVHLANIERNKITEVLSTDFPVDSKLSLLSLKDNAIQTISPDTFSHLSALQKLHLSGNGITELRDQMLHGLTNLTELEIGKNPITQIDAKFAADLHKLEILDLSYVEDTEPIIKGNFFRDIPYLKVLSLRCSPSLTQDILTSSEMIESFHHLQKLDLRDNQLQTSNTDLPRYFPNLQTIQLAHNAWICDSRLLWLHDWVQRKREIFADIEDVLCAMPMHLAGELIADLPFHAFFYTTTVTERAETEPMREESGEYSIDAGSGVTEFTTVISNHDESSTPESTNTLLLSSLPSIQQSSRLSKDFFKPKTTETKTLTKLPTTNESFENNTSHFDKADTIFTTPLLSAASSSRSTTSGKRLLPTSSSTESSPLTTLNTGLSQTDKDSLTTASSTLSDQKDTTNSESNPTVNTVSSPLSTSAMKQSSDTTGNEISTAVTNIKEISTAVANGTVSITGEEKYPKTTTNTKVSATLSVDTTLSSISSLTTSTTITFITSTVDSGVNESGQRMPKSHPSANQSAASTEGSEISNSATSFTSSPLTTITPLRAASSGVPPLTTVTLLTRSTSGSETSSTTKAIDTFNQLPTDNPTSDSTVNRDISNDIPNFRGSRNRMPSVADTSARTQSIIIAVSVTIIFLIITLIVAAFILRHRKQIKRAYLRAFSYTIEASDTAFVLNDQDDPDSFQDSRSTPDQRSPRASHSVEDTAEADQNIDMLMWKEY